MALRLQPPSRSDRAPTRALRSAALARRALFALLAILVLAPVARAADPIMPLSEVRAGMRCTALSVVKGTEISSFDVEILDTIAPELGLTGPRLLIRVSGPAIAGTGVGPGFSGSPIYCDGRNAGAISESIGDYGNFVVLATPIEEILADAPAPTPQGARAAGALAREARPLTSPLTASGLSPRSRRLLSAVAGRARRTLLAAPSGPVGGYPPQELRPGAAVAAGLASGDIRFGAVGTVAYRDGDRLWAFGHPLDDLGPRSLFMQDAYVFSVINNPLGLAEGAQTYKLATGGGHDLGAFTTDADAAIAGTVGSEPPSVPLRVVAHAAGRTTLLQAKLADERRYGLGAGVGLLAPLAVQTALQQAQRSIQPAHVDVCARFAVRGRKRPLGFCNGYASVDGALFDLIEAGGLVESYNLPTLPLEGVELVARARTGTPSDVIVAATPPRDVRAGSRVRVRLELRRRGTGASRTISVPVRVPSATPRGPRTLVVEGTSASAQAGLEDELFGAFELLFDDLGPDLQPPRSVKQLDERLRSLHHPEGIVARFRGGPGQLVRGSQDVLFEGRVRVPVRVRRAARG